VATAPLVQPYSGAGYRPLPRGRVRGELGFPSFQGRTASRSTASRLPPGPAAPARLGSAMREGIAAAGRPRGRGVVPTVSPDDTAGWSLANGREPAANVVAPALHRDRPGQGGGTSSRRLRDGLLNTASTPEYQRWLGPRPGPGGHVGRLEGCDRRGALAAIPDFGHRRTLMIGSPARFGRESRMSGRYHVSLSRCSAGIKES